MKKLLILLFVVAASTLAFGGVSHRQFAVPGVTASGDTVWIASVVDILDDLIVTADNDTIWILPHQDLYMLDIEVDNSRIFSVDSLGNVALVGNLTSADAFPDSIADHNIRINTNTNTNATQDDSLDAHNDRINTIVDSLTKDFKRVYGELIINNHFSTADYWSIENGWTWDEPSEKMYRNSGSTGSISVTKNNMVLYSTSPLRSTWYMLKYTISDYSNNGGGTLTVVKGTTSMADVEFEIPHTNGTYTRYFKSRSGAIVRFELEATGNDTYYIDNIYLQMAYGAMPAFLDSLDGFEGFGIDISQAAGIGVDTSEVATPYDISQVEGGAHFTTIVIAASNSLNPTGADYICDGTADDIEIQNALDEITVGGSIKLLEGTFSIADECTLKTTHTQIIGSGWGTVLNVTSSIAQVFYVNGKGSIVIRDLVIRGNGIVSDGIYAYDCRIPEFKHLRIGDVTSNGIQISGTCYETLIDHCNIGDTGSDGIYIAGGVNPTVSNCRIDSTGESGIYCDSGERGSIINNMIEKPKYWGLRLPNAGKVTVSGNLFIDHISGSNNSDGIYAKYGSELSFVANHFEGVWRHGILIEECDNVSIIGNEIVGWNNGNIASPVAAFYIKGDCQGVEIDGNSMQGTSADNYYGIYVDNWTSKYHIGNNSFVGIIGTANIFGHSGWELWPDLVADSTWSGDAIYDTVGTEVFAGDFVFSPADGDYELADATDSTTVLCVGLVMAHADADKPTYILKSGYARLDSWDWTKFGTISDGLFLSETAGDATQKCPSTSGCYIQVVGRIVDEDIIFFNPSVNWVKHE